MSTTSHVLYLLGWAVIGVLLAVKYPPKELFKRIVRVAPVLGLWVGGVVVLLLVGILVRRVVLGFTHECKPGASGGSACVVCGDGL
jgi:hypothetical protein